MYPIQLLTLFAATTAAAAQDYRITTYTVDGGGASNLSGGVYVQSGTIGQPDAGAALVGGVLELHGGFWPGVSRRPRCLADLAAPFGTLNFFDVATYISFYNSADPAADLAAPFGSFNFFDVAAFIGFYNAGCP
ncbi:MAG: GC-type dockerin domain-anchored protein [Phycisphaerales bacterium]